MGPAGSVWAHFKTERSHIPQDDFNTPPDPKKQFQGRAWGGLLCFPEHIANLWTHRDPGNTSWTWEAIMKLGTNILIPRSKILVASLSRKNWARVTGGCRAPVARESGGLKAKTRGGLSGKWPSKAPRVWFERIFIWTSAISFWYPKLPSKSRFFLGMPDMRKS